MTHPATINRFVFGLAAFIAMRLNGALTFLSLGEFYNIKILRHRSGYPFGGEGPVPYYYKTAALYANVHLASGLAFFLVFLFAVRAAVKRQGQKILLLLVVTVLLLLIFLIQGQALD